MIYVEDNFLPSIVFESLLSYSNDFKEVKTPGKSFWVKELPGDLTKYITDKLEAIEGKKIKNILSFLREAKEGQDNDWRIHNDSIIEGEQPDRAIVLYVKSSETELNGTAFWEHEDYEFAYVKSDVEEFNRMLAEDSNDITKWKLNSVIGHRDNRLLSYPSEYFHSKYPNKFKNQRVVLVMFYKYERQETK
tara:strand:- start:583 stop:1155 length:573 start_codon:yes stop_codon:yes gene_type:complete